MNTTGYTVTRSDGVVYHSIAAAARENRVSESTIRRYAAAGIPIHSGFSFTITAPRGGFQQNYERMSVSTICPICGRSTRCVTGFCGGCYRKLDIVNRKEDAYRAASVYA